LAPAQPISGAAAYDRYIAHTLPYLAESGGALLFLEEGGPFLIGPEGERWDRAMLVKQNSVQAFAIEIRDCCRWSRHRCRGDDRLLAGTRSVAS
jgi:hypothetical protein